MANIANVFQRQISLILHLCAIGQAPRQAAECMQSANKGKMNTSAGFEKRAR
jgi:hypothetical protein